VTRGTLLAALGGRTAELGSQALLILLLPALLGASDFGSFSVVQGFVAFGATATGLGAPTLIARLVAARPEVERPSIARAVLLEGLEWRVSALAVGVVVAAGLAITVPNVVTPAAVAIGSCALVLSAAGTWASFIALGLGHVAVWSYRYAVQNAATAVAVAVGYGIFGLDGALGGLVVGAAAGLLWAGRFSAHVLRAPRVPAPAGTRRLAVLLTVSAIAPQVVQKLLVPLVALMAGTVAAGNAAIGIGVALAAMYTVAHPFAATMPDLLRRAVSPERIEVILITLGRRALAVAGVISVVGAAVGAPLVPAILGHEFRPASEALGLALASVPLAAANAVLGQLATLHLQLRTRALMNAVSAAVGLGVCVSLAPWLGPDAGALGLLAASVTVVLIGRETLSSAGTGRLVGESIAVSAAVVALTLAVRL
jgi:O-antigen/teichoic acid export membrane protein